MIRMILFTSTLLLANLGYPGVAHAYLDLGTGTMILQGIIASIAAAAAVVGIYWQKIEKFFAGGRRSDLHEDDQNLGSR